MKIVNLQCPNCGAALEIDAEAKKAFCTYCGAKLQIDDEIQHIQYDNAEETGYQFEKGRQRAQAESGYYQQTPQPAAKPSVVQQPPKKRKTVWWVLGWIFIFPLPLTILLARNKNMKPVLKIGLIALAWIVYFGIGMSRNKNSETSKTPQPTKPQTEASAVQDKPGKTTPSKETEETFTTTPVTEQAATEPAQTIYELSSGSYVFGVDLPSGRAKVTGISGQGNVLSSDYDGFRGINSAVVTDESGNASMPAIFESYAFEEGAFLYISQTAVVQFEFTSISVPAKGREYSSKPTYKLDSGTYTVGVDIEPGVYKVVASSGKGNFIVGDYTEGGANEILAAEEDGFSSSFSNVFLVEGDDVVITMGLHIKLYKSKD